MLNRVADALFWIGRYLERAENHTRLISTIYHLNNQKAKRSDLVHWQQMLRLIGNEEDFLTSYSEVNENNVLHYVTLKSENQNSIASCINIARNNMRLLREKMPSECWETLNSLYLWIHNQSVSDIYAETPFKFYKRIQEQLHSFQGTMYSSMIRDMEWHFIESGKFLERADNGLRMIQAIHFNLVVEQPKSDYLAMLSLLRAVNGYEAYRQVYAERISLQSVMEFMLMHHTFPRSILHSLTLLERHLRQMTPHHNQPQLLQHKVLARVSKVRAELLCMEKTEFTVDRIGGHLDMLIENCEDIGLHIERHFFHEVVVSA